MNKKLYGGLGQKLLTLVGDEMLRPEKYKEFNLSAILNFLFINIYEMVRRGHEGCSDLEKATRVSSDLRIYCGETIFLLVECIAEYLKNGEYLIYDYKIKTYRRITNFKFKVWDLDFMLLRLEDHIKYAENGGVFTDYFRHLNDCQERIKELYEILKREREKYE